MRPSPDYFGHRLTLSISMFIFASFVCSALVLARPSGHLLSPELSSSFGGGGGPESGGSGSVIRTGLYPRSTATSAALHYAHSTPRVNAGDLTQPSLQAGQTLNF